MPNSHPSFAIIIPYYQRRAGILRRALTSVSRQRGVSPSLLNIFVVDDGSPIPAESEIDGLSQDFSGALTIIRQPNAGPGAARNAGIARVPKSIPYIAFLDSDDEWAEDHLMNARFALAAGYDCYFANFYQVGQTIGAFERAGRVQLRDHSLISGSTSIREFCGDMFNQIITGNIIGTPTVVFDFQKFPDIRFRKDLRSAGEDYLYWMDLATRGARFAFSNDIAVICGAGLNIYSGSSWGTEGHLLRVQNEIKYRKLILKCYPVTNAQLQHVNGAIKRLRVEFLQALIHRLTRLQSLPLRVLVAQIRNDPVLLFSLVPTLVRILFGRA